MKWEPTGKTRDGDVEITASAQVTGGNGTPKTVMGYVNGYFFPVIFDIDWKQAEEIHISVDIDYAIFIFGAGWSGRGLKASGQGSYKIDQAWRIVYGDNGITLEPKPSKQSAHDDGGGYAVAVQLQPDQTAHEGGPTYVSLLTTLVGGYKEDGVSVGVQYEGVSGSVPVTNGSSESETIDFELKVFLHVRGKPEEPAKPAPIDIPNELLSHIVYFDERMSAGKRPGEDSADLSATELRRLDDNWGRPLQKEAPELYAVIKNGDCPILLFGYASNTATDAYDRDLSQRRIESVEQSIQDVFHSGLRFETYPMGHGTAEKPGPVPREKRVDIQIDRQTAQSAIEEARRKKKP